ncbi:DNA-binding response regulator [Streptomyces sp. CBMA152]|nr:response regulator transcription factor [Streptomyces sp. CBMA152]MBD0742415.1 DNA-binding response regulator [Streptomyces sp. CBMA152]
MTDVLVVDDQILIRAGIAALLRAAPGFTTVTEAADGESAVAAARAHRPDVILMDIRLPGIDGITAAEHILAAQPVPPPRIIVLTTFDVDEYVYAALRAGASGFLLKDTPPERLISAITTIASGDMLFAPAVTRRLIEAYTTRPGEPRAEDGVLSRLTGREQDVLRLVAKGLSNEEIAVELVVSEATIKTHLHRTMTKLRLRSRAQAVAVAYEAGLVVVGGGRGRGERGDASETPVPGSAAARTGAAPGGTATPDAPTRANSRRPGSTWVGQPSAKDIASPRFGVAPAR